MYAVLRRRRRCRRSLLFGGTCRWTPWSPPSLPTRKCPGGHPKTRPPSSTPRRERPRCGGLVLMCANIKKEERRRSTHTHTSHTHTHVPCRCRHYFPSSPLLSSPQVLPSSASLSDHHHHHLSIHHHPFCHPRHHRHRTIHHHLSIHHYPFCQQVADQQAWKIPPCISNYKNVGGFTIPLVRAFSLVLGSVQRVSLTFAVEAR